MLTLVRINAANKETLLAFMLNTEALKKHFIADFLGNETICYRYKLLLLLGGLKMTL